MEMSSDDVQKRKESPFMDKSRDNEQKKCVYINNEMRLTIILQLSFTKTNHFFQLPPFYLVHPWLTTLLLPWTS